MKQRQSERVQFFQLSHEADVRRVWVFQRTVAESVMGLLLDISAQGIQILTDKSAEMQEGSYRLFVHTDENTESIVIPVRRIWAKPDGTLYLRNGFEFEDGEDLVQSVERVLAARDAGMKWLRCELVRL